MSSKEKSYRNIQHKIPLIDFLPWRTPLSIYIDPCNLCNFKCSFCPTAHKGLLKSAQRPMGMMSMDLFKKTVDGIKFPEKIKALHLFKDGEPLLHEDIIEMIRYAKSKQIAEKVELTTNGSLLTDSLIESLVDSGLDIIRVSIEHVDDAGYKRITKTFSDYEQIRSHVRKLFDCKKAASSEMLVFVKITNVDLSESEKQKFQADFGAYCDHYNFDEVIGWSNGFHNVIKTSDKSIDGLFSLNKRRIVCPEPFKTMVVNFNGDVSVCCADWSMGIKVGNTNEEALSAVWSGDKLKALRMMHVDGRRKEIKVCSDCQFVEGVDPISDLDAHREEIKAALNRQ